MTFMRKTQIVSALCLTTIMVAAPQVQAQLTNASASTLALAGNHTASVRGFGAISVNPAGLGMPGSGFSLAVLPVMGRAGLAPITLSDLADFEGTLIPTSTKEAWLDDIVAAGGEQGSVGAEVTLLALTMGNLGFQLSGIGSVDAVIPVGVAEALLYGNAGRTGTATDLSLAGAAIESFGVSTAALSYALPVNDALVLGATGKYIRGHGVAVARSVSGALESDPIRATLDFAAVTTCTDDTEVLCEQDFVNGGGGLGLDVGAMLDLGGITLGASVQNLINTFEWDETKLGYRPGTLLVEDGNSEDDFDEQPFENAPDDIKAIIRDYTFQPSYRLGAALDVTPALTLTGDIHGELGDDGISLGQGYHTGVGAELRAGFIHLRAGLAKISDGMQYGGGLSLVLGPVNLSLAGGLQKGDERDAAMSQFVFSFGGR
jgi:hypothetical protein